MAVVIAAVLLLSMVFSASARTTRTEFTVYEYVCMTDPGKVWMEGDILHIRGIKHTNVDISDTPQVNGLNTTTADGDINLKTGYAAIRGTFNIQPEEVQGTWEGTWTFIGNPGIARGRAVGKGTGELSGKTIFLELLDTPYNPDTEAICEGIGDPESNTDIRGYILEPGS